MLKSSFPSVSVVYSYPNKSYYTPYKLFLNFRPPLPNTVLFRNMYILF